MTYRTREQMQNETAAARNCSILLIAEHFGYSLKQHGNYYFADGERAWCFSLIQILFTIIMKETAVQELIL